ncbi:hypothetical protein MXMO3_03328 [Maritalea myrionectae]|uniref:Activator of Hsp90 ATPase homologue 1/2-like C-terminal domain-containing protein n=1 Tax=Maritalea myrionectae TaxID=454601 RepID=A0A2R4MIS6_9HYPH|nr:SRPBCC domain-containing protein [Maritalea myrionectae]AVX05833.1 hypothetical protein MXMO3_03328 [Maritalea myrionectae]
MAEPVAIAETVHDERVMKASPARVYMAFADAEARKRWEPTPPDMEMRYGPSSFEVGAHEESEMIKDGEVMAAFDTRYIDILPEKRIVSSIRVKAGGQIMSCSQSTVELVPEGNGTRVICYEQVVWFGGQNMKKEHQEGWRTLLDGLQNEVEESAA